MYTIVMQSGTDLCVLAFTPTKAYTLWLYCCQDRQATLSCHEATSHIQPDSVLLCTCHLQQPVHSSKLVEVNPFQAQRDAVYNSEAEHAFSEGRHIAAARSWGKVKAPQPSFEELALKFVGTGSPEVLQTYLLTKLDALAPADKAQVSSTYRQALSACHLLCSF